MKITEGTLRRIIREEIESVNAASALKAAAVNVKEAQDTAPERELEGREKAHFDKVSNGMLTAAQNSNGADLTNVIPKIVKQIEWLRSKYGESATSKPLTMAIKQLQGVL